MTREEHLKWSIKRAIEEMDYYHDPDKALVSMMSDLRKHPETNDVTLQSMCVEQFGKLPRQAMINFLNGFK
jgi:hypothetical protein